MSNILAGLFEHRSDYKKLEADLETQAFRIQITLYILMTKIFTHNI
ncbi:hypothetical protein ACFOEQ_26645 [Chryseobacterium arachidis]